MIFRTFEVNLEGTFTRKCKIKLIYFVFCSFIRTFALGNTKKRVSGLKNALKRKIMRKNKN